LRGTHQAAFAGFPPTGKQAVLHGTDFIRVANGKLVELWNCSDTLNWAQLFRFLMNSTNQERSCSVILRSAQNDRPTHW
jgi:SnoaL-like polyketide cyclase